jgi:hypothetical protein
LEEERAEPLISSSAWVSEDEGVGCVGSEGEGAVTGLDLEALLSHLRAAQHSLGTLRCSKMLG